MIELKILIDEIDYDSVADFLVPLLVEKLKKEDRTGLFGSVLSGNSAMASNMARGPAREAAAGEEGRAGRAAAHEESRQAPRDGPHCRREKRHPPADLRCIGEENLTSPARNGAPRGYPDRAFPVAIVHGACYDMK